MGGKWVKKHDMSSLLMALNLESVHQEVMEHKWRRFTRFVEDKKKQSQQEPDEATEPNEGKEIEMATGSGAGQKQPKAGARGKGVGKAKTDTKVTGKPPKTPKPSPTQANPVGSNEDSAGAETVDKEINKRKAQEIKTLNKDCQKIKTMLKECQADSTTMLAAFEGDPAYAWGKNNPKADQELKTTIESTQDLTPFITDYMMNVFATIQKKYDADTIIAELNGFKEKKDGIKDLSELLDRLKRMQAANSK
jgi:hypothetical protein